MLILRSVNNRFCSPSKHIMQSGEKNGMMMFENLEISIWILN